MAEDDSLSTKEIAGIIPLFFYDAIGRILPGTTLIVGVLLYFNWASAACWETSFKELFPPASSAGYVLVALLMLLGIAQVLGILLGSASHTFFEHIVPFLLKPFGKPSESTETWLKRILPWPCKLNICGLQKHMGLANTEELKKRYREHFGSSLPDEDLNGPSFVCGYYAWRMDPNLGLITARSDAEALAARSLTLAFLVLSFMPVLGHLFLKLDGSISRNRWEIVLLPLLFICGSYFNYTRKKRVFDRFALFLAVTSRLGITESGFKVPQKTSLSATPLPHAFIQKRNFYRVFVTFSSTTGVCRSF